MERKVKLSFRNASALPEVMVALVVFTITTAFFLVFFSSNLFLDAKAIKREKAFLITKSLSNYLQSLEYDDPCLMLGNHSCENNTCCAFWKDVNDLWYYVDNFSSDIKQVCSYYKYDSGKQSLCFLIKKR